MYRVCNLRLLQNSGEQSLREKTTQFSGEEHSLGDYIRRMGGREIHWSLLFRGIEGRDSGLPKRPGLQGALIGVLKQVTGLGEA